MKTCCSECFTEVVCELPECQEREHVCHFCLKSAIFDTIVEALESEAYRNNDIALSLVADDIKKYARERDGR